MLRVSPCVHVRTHIYCCVTYMLKGMEMENSQMHFYQVNTLIQPALGSGNGPF